MSTVTTHSEKRTRTQTAAPARPGEPRSTVNRLGAWLRRWDHANRNRRVYPTPWL